MGFRAFLAQNRRTKCHSIELKVTLFRTKRHLNRTKSHSISN
nr:MAG TPA: hypothetical protein [Caudoviricetes sp.]